MGLNLDIGNIQLINGDFDSLSNTKTPIDDYILRKNNELSCLILTPEKLEFSTKKALLEEIYLFYSNKELLTNEDKFNLIFFFQDDDEFSKNRLDSFNIENESIDINEFILYHLNFLEPGYYHSIGDIDKDFMKCNTNISRNFYYKFNYKKASDIFNSIKNNFNFFKGQISLDVFYNIYSKEKYNESGIIFYDEFKKFILNNKNIRIIPKFKEIKKELEENKFKFSFDDDSVKQEFISFILMYSRFEIDNKNASKDLNYFYSFFDKKINFLYYQDNFSNIVNFEPINNFISSSPENFNLFEEFTLKYFINGLKTEPETYSDSGRIFIEVDFSNNTRELYLFLKNNYLIFKNEELNNFFNSKIITKIISY